MISLKRRPRVFISYSHLGKGPVLARALENWLQARGCQPVVDWQDLEEFDRLELVLHDMIDGCDALVAIGTEEFLTSSYCEQEVNYALNRDKCYFPLLFDSHRAVHSLPDWFSRRGRKGGTLILGTALASATQNTAGSFARLESILPRLRNRVAMDLRWGIALALLLFLTLPSLAALGLRRVFTNAGAEVQQIQASIEATNRAIEGVNPHSSIRLQYDGRVGASTLSYRDTSSGELIARDTVAGRLVAARTYYRKGREIAVDRVEVRRAPNGQETRIKTREILEAGRTGLLIRDRFDSSGTLISKEVRWPGSPGWHRYGDLGSSLYPTAVRFFLPYR
jgi:TIR domain